ncbi:MAG TPA: DUF481 domain-containing protein [Terriglobales bacterium]|nr:DUF481 domain-containing protein [Terriglobales bacterium]
MKRVSIVFLLLFVPALLTADEVVLKNGNHLTGTIVKLDDNKLVLNTDFADTINIKWDAISSFTAKTPVIIQTPDRKLDVASLERKDGNVDLTTTSGQPVEIEAANVKAIRSQGEQVTYEKSLHPGVLESWAGGVNFGLALATGNSDTLNVSTGMNLNRTTTTDKINTYLTTVYSKDNNADKVTANAIQGGFRYDRNITRKLFAYGGSDFNFDSLQHLDIRAVPNGGLGWHAINSPTTVLDVFFGVAYTYESYSTGITNHLFSPSVGEQLTHKLNSRTNFTEKAFIFPYVTGGQAGNYRFAFDAGVSTKISRWLTWQTSLSNIYVSNPPPGTKGNDLLLTTGIGLTLAGRK